MQSASKAFKDFYQFTKAPERQRVTVTGISVVFKPDLIGNQTASLSSNSNDTHRVFLGLCFVLNS